MSRMSVDVVVPIVFIVPMVPIGLIVPIVFLVLIFPIAHIIPNSPCSPYSLSYPHIPYSPGPWVSEASLGVPGGPRMKRGRSGVSGLILAYLCFCSPAVCVAHMQESLSRATACLRSSAGRSRAARRCSSSCACGRCSDHESRSKLQKLAVVPCSSS